MSAKRPCGAFTLIEVMASVIILSLGLISAIGMLLYGLQLAKLSIGRATGLATAMTVAIDPSPLLPADPLWTVAVPGTTTGYLNGHWVERWEGPATVVAPGIAAADVRVDIYETLRGRLVASYNQRIVKVVP
jgi:Tfp pilus assembly protein PilV